MNNEEWILYILKDIKEYKKIVSTFLKNGIEDYPLIVLKGSLVCQNMLEFLLIQKDISTPINRPILMYCCQDKSILPEECRSFLHQIRIVRNVAAHAMIFDKKAIESFSKAFNYFTAWFCYEYIWPISKSIGMNAHSELQDLTASIEQLILKVKNEMESASTDAAIVNELLKKIEQQTQMIIELTNKVHKLDERGERVEKLVQEIDKKMSNLLLQINSYQTLLANILERVDSELEKDRIIQGFTDECVMRIIEITSNNTETKMLELEKRKLIDSLGESAWNKLEETSRTFLVSAKLMYNHLLLADDNTDYSGVCVLITKALEVELSKRFYRNYLNYLDIKYHRNYTNYPSTLLYNGSRPLKSEKFTMGSIAYAMGYRENYNDTETQKLKNKNCLMDYCRTRLFPTLTDVEIKDVLYEYGYAVEKVRNDYRNPAAHTNEIHKVDAEECFNLVIEVEKLLKRMIDSFAE